MGITIYASGKIDSIDELPRLIEDVKAVAGKHNWTYRSIEDDFGMQPNAALSVNETPGKGASINGSLGLKGLILKVAPNVETLAVLFDCNGVLTDVMNQLSWIEEKGRGKRFTMCKTQFGSIDSHIHIVELLDMLKKKYISNLSVIDEGAYWESRDPRLLAEKRVELGRCLRHVEKVIRNMEISEVDARDRSVLLRGLKRRCSMRRRKNESSVPTHVITRRGIFGVLTGFGLSDIVLPFCREAILVLHFSSKFANSD